MKDSLVLAIPHISKMHLNIGNQKLKTRAAVKRGPASSFYGVSLPVLIMLVAGGVLDDAEAFSAIAEFCADQSGPEWMKAKISMPKNVSGHGFLYIPDTDRFQRFECEHIEIVLYRKPSTCAELSDPLWMTSGYCVYAKTFYPVP